MLIAERYRVLERLGTGGMATVLLAEDERLGRQVALKRMHPGVGPEVVERFRREARLGASLTHPNVVSVYDVLAHEDQVVLVMEYVEGRTLADMLTEGGLGSDEAMAILRPLAAALDHAHHEGVVHRDVKPANVLVRTDGAVKLADLGIATGADLTSMTATGTALGTVAYMAPEQLEGKGVTAAADVYALATVAFEMLSGRKARAGATPMEIVHRIATGGPPDLSEAWPEAPQDAGEVLRRAMAWVPAERPSSAGDLVRQLEVALGGGEPEAAAAATLPRDTLPGDTATLADETAGLPRDSPALGGDATPPPGDAASPPPGDTAPPPGDTAPPRGAAPPPPKAAPPPPVAPARPGRVPSRRPLPGRPRRARAIAAGALSAALALLGVVVALTAVNDESPAPQEPGRESEQAPVPAAPSLGRPERVVRAFYGRAAADRFDAAWSLAAPSFRAQLRGFDTFKATFGTLESISFDRAETTRRTGKRATVAIATTAVHTDRTDTCEGEVSLVSSASRWLIERIAVDC